MNEHHFLSIVDSNRGEIKQILKLAQVLKRELKSKGRNKPLLQNKTLVMIFEKPSLRTRLSFEVGMTQLGGHAVYLSPSDIGLGQRESVSDIARVVSRMGDIIMARVFKHGTLAQLAEHSTVPVINALSDHEHPCQALADALTIIERKGSLKGKHIAFIGDAENNVAHSLALICALHGAHFRVAAPQGYEMKKDIATQARAIAAKTGGTLMETSDPVAAATGADVIYTDTWVSMGDEPEKLKRCKVFEGYRVTEVLMSLAKRDAIFMHDLPAYRGNEVEAAVIDGPQSAVFEQAENRLHAQKALILWLLQKKV